MLVKFTNPSSTAPVYISQLYKEIAPLAFVETRRAMADLEKDQGLKAQVAAGLVTLAFTEETGDDAALGFMSALKSYTNAGKPTPAAVPTYSAVFITDLNKPLWSDGVAWRDSAGTIVP